MRFQCRTYTFLLSSFCVFIFALSYFHYHIIVLSNFRYRSAVFYYRTVAFLEGDYVITSGAHVRVKQKTAVQMDEFIRTQDAHKMC